MILCLVLRVVNQMGGFLDRLEYLSPQGKTYSVSARSHMDSPASTDRPQSVRHRGQWDGTPQAIVSLSPLESEREILHQTAVAYWLSEHNVWEPVIEGRSSLTLFKLIIGNDRLKVTVHRDNLTMELGVIWLSRVEVVRTDQTGVYWEDMRGRVWGVRFLMETDTLRFLAACSLDSHLGPEVLAANVRWVPPLPADRTERPDSENTAEKRENDSDEEDLLDSSLHISSGWKEGDLLKAVVEEFNSRNLSELQDLDSLSFTQLLLSPDKELPQELSFDSHTSDGDKDSKKSDKSLSYDALALHYSIDHFTQAFVSESTPVETTQPVVTDSNEVESVADTEDSFEPVVIELEDTEIIYSHNYDYQVDIETLDETLRRLDVSSNNRLSYPGSRRSSLLIQQEKLIISPEKIEGSTLRTQDLEDSFIQTDVSSGLSESPSLARYSSLPVIPVSARLDLETTSEISLNSFLQLSQPENLIVSSKSGWLEVSKLMYYKKKRLHVSTKNRWKRHWCCLRGASLLLYSRESSSLLDNDRAEPVLCLDLEGGLVQSAFECFKRNHVFTISLPNGHAYYMQAITQGEMIQWIQQLHCSAAIACTRQLNRSLAVEKLTIRCVQLEAEIEGDLRIKERAESKILSTQDSSLKEKLRNELVPLVLSVELLQAELYRTNCYIAALNNTDLPTPDTFLSTLSVTTKQSIKKLGLFTASITYAFICENTTISNQQFVLKNSLFAAIKEHSSRLSQIQTPTKRKKLKQILEILPSTSSELSLTTCNNLTADSVSASKSIRNEKIYTSSPKDAPPHSVEIKYPDGEVSHIMITHSSLIIDVLLYSCINKNLDPQDYYVQINHSDNPSDHSSPSEHDYFRNHKVSSLELRSKSSHVIDLYPVDELELGFTLEVLEKNIYGKFIQSYTVSQIIRGGQADIFGLELGDEVISINNTSTQTLSLETVYSLLNQESVRIEFKTKRRKLPYSAEEIELINTLICPAPPASTSRLSTHEIGPLVIPNPKHLSFMSIRELSEVEAPDGDCEERDLLQTLMTDSQELNYSVRLRDNGYPLEEGVPSHLSRLTKCCNELILTEKEFISALGLLLQRYLKSLQQESFVTHSEMVCLYENTKQVIARQNEFFSQLKSALSLQTDDQTSNLIISISNLFIQHSQSFRLFSMFCTSYRNAQELINSNNEEVLAFLAARNPHNKHELRFDSLLALPIQRILRYPLFLRNMRDSVSKGSEEYKKISNAIQVLDRVAGYIDEIQYMSEKFSSLFNGILTESGLRKVGVHVDIVELKHKFDVNWLNPTEETGKWKKKGDGPEMTLFLLPRLLIVISYDNKFKQKLSKHGIIEFRELDDLVHYKLALLLFYCTFKDFPDSDGVSNMVSIGSQGIEQQVNLIIKCKSRPDKARLIREFKFAIEQVNFT